MLLSSILLLAATVAGFTIPDGQADGLYVVVRDAEGVENHLPIQLSNAVVPRTPLNSAKFVQERQIPNSVNTYTCGNEPLNHVNATDAVNELALMCYNWPEFGTFEGPMQAYSLFDCVVAYFCNFKKTKELCNPAEVYSTFQLITGACGSYISGWDRARSSAVDLSIGYENVCSKGNNFCAVGLDGV